MTRAYYLIKRFEFKTFRDMACEHREWTMWQECIDAIDKCARSYKIKPFKG
jgi:DUF2075 family protein